MVVITTNGTAFTGNSNPGKPHRGDLPNSDMPAGAGGTGFRAVDVLAFAQAVERGHVWRGYLRHDWER